MEYKAMELDLLEAIDLPQQQPYIYFEMEITSLIDTDKLYQAILNAMKQIPELGCCYHKKSHRWIPLDALCKECFIEEVTSIDFHTWNLLQHPQIRIQLVHKEDGCQLAVGVSHILSDGNGALQLLYMLCDFYNGTSVSTICNERILIHQPMKDRDRKKKKVVKVKAMRSHGKVSDKQHEVCIQSTDIKVIRKKAKSYHVTVNDSLMCAYVQMLHVCVGSNEVSLPCPVNLRPFLKDCPSTTVTNFTGEYSVAISNLDKKEEVDIVKEIHMQMLEERKCNRDLKMMKLFSRYYAILPLWLCRMLVHSIYRIPAVSFTNLGVLDETRLRFHGGEVLHAHVVTRERVYPSFQISAITFRDECTLSCNCIATAQDIQAGKERLTIMRNLLHNGEWGC